jgi:hypothetical protein
MREIRMSGSEGGGAEPNRPSLPLFFCRRFAPGFRSEATLTGVCTGRASGPLDPDPPR